MNEMKCPITGVNMPRFLLATIVGFGFIFGYDFVIHTMLLKPTYELTPKLWRPPEEMKMDWMMGTQFLIAAITAFIYTRNVEGKGIMEGVRYGLMIGLLMGVLMGASYAWMPISMGLALSWFASGVGLGLGLGVIFSLTYKPCGASKKSEESAA